MHSTSPYHCSSRFAILLPKLLLIYCTYCIRVSHPLPQNELRVVRNGRSGVVGFYSMLQTLATPWSEAEGQAGPDGHAAVGALQYVGLHLSVENVGRQFLLVGVFLESSRDP